MHSRKTYRIGEAAEILKLKTHVLRFWETEFPQIKPLRAESGQRLYTDDQIDLLRRIQHLLHEQGMTIDGAKRQLAGDKGQLENPTSELGFRNAVYAELEAICSLLENTGHNA